MFVGDMPKPRTMACISDTRPRLQLVTVRRSRLPIHPSASTNPSRKAERTSIGWPNIHDGTRLVFAFPINPCSRNHRPTRATSVRRYPKAVSLGSTLKQSLNAKRTRAFDSSCLLRAAQVTNDLVGERAPLAFLFSLLFMVTQPSPNMKPNSQASDTDIRDSDRDGSRPDATSRSPFFMSPSLLHSVVPSGRETKNGCLAFALIR